MDHPMGYAHAPVNLVCSRLRQHPAWASTATYLLQADGRRWREAYLGTHDLALSIADPHTERYEVIRLLLLSAENINNPGTLSRINELGNSNPTGNAALIFLLQPDGAKGTQPAMQAFMELHIRLSTTQPHHLPIIPLPTLADLPTALQTFQSSLAALRARTWLPPVVDAASDLLPYCAITTTTNNHNNNMGMTSVPGHTSSNGNNGHKQTGLSHRTSETLSQVFFSFRELLEGISTKEGQGEVKRVVGEAEGEGVIAFWRWEFESG